MMSDSQKDAVRFAAELDNSFDPSTGLPISTVASSSATIEIASSSSPSLPEITCAYPSTDLSVLKELHVDFENLAQNGFDLSAEVNAQGWNSYFERLKGPIFVDLVKEFWIHAEYNHLNVTSHVMEEKIVITEKSIVALLSMEFLKNKKVYGKKGDSDFMKNVINKAIFTNYEPEKVKYKSTDLQLNLRI